MSFFERARFARGDDGVALVAAMGVALVGIAVAAVVITQTIVAVNDSGRDRLRTTEIHAAEAAIDATMAELEYESPCGAPSFSPLTLNADTQATEVTVQIEYYNDDSASPISCSGGNLTALPNRATVTATAEGLTDSVGLNPVRVMQSSLALEPRTQLSEDAAIFSATDVFVGAGFTLSPQLLDQKADVWIDGGNFNCSGGAKMNGSLIVPDGSVNFSNSACHVGGDLWTQDGATFPSTASAKYSVDGNTTVRSGNLENNNPISLGGDVTVGGSKVTAQPLTANGTVRFNVGADSIQNITPVGLPVINYVPSDWTGFVRRDHMDLARRINDQYPLKDWNKPYPEKCEYLGWIGEIKGPVKLPSTPTMYDLQGCRNGHGNGFYSASGFGFELYADTVIFANNFKSVNPLTFSSGDGRPHTLWVIVPNSTGSGSINISTPMTVMPPIESFWYAPGDVHIQNSSQFIGQVYGGDVDVHTPATFVYSDVGVPGVDLVSAAQSSSGFVVELLYKREVS
ncbi:hypothetical protein [Demequina globuliformis]|uniref:hypothetical protein n=1 Tax=Demequina globuliformis TaxID=676202 RepID=UPI000780A54D|nr:hypothetical protein [Demequina globuliformis]